MNRRPVAGAAAETNGADRVSAIVLPHADQDPRPRCAVVGIYCESLGCLAREPRHRATVCCRAYWADVEAGVAS